MISRKKQKRSRRIEEKRESADETAGGDKDITDMLENARSERGKKTGEKGDGTEIEWNPGIEVLFISVMKAKADFEDFQSP